MNEASICLREMRNVCKIVSGDLNGRDLFGDISIDGKITLK
jgi:hypothetical protein